MMMMMSELLLKLNRHNITTLLAVRRRLIAGDVLRISAEERSCESQSRREMVIQEILGMT
jgi:hypothetical protein